VIVVGTTISRFSMDNDYDDLHDWFKDWFKEQCAKPPKKLRNELRKEMQGFVQNHLYYEDLVHNSSAENESEIYEC
jgi:hypothetical protein